QKARGVSTAHIAKRMLDFGVHAPTVYFPLVVPEAMMIEPTETESRETLNQFISIMKEIDKESIETPDTVKDAPHNTPVKKLDEALAARKPNLRWSPDQ
ncbi:MAG TPA: aminomethyl-transferring glycine dehydrogenase subunit GcvPB, partial [Candidatus Melainabacteria bacterium]|nr:aminomethyl-transferring glycine dehydrogenase subunit GcvPB [Candidatus Melainabacteria bacterium]